MTWHTHPDASRLIRANWHRAECFLIAQRAPCIRIRDDEVKHVDRLLHGGFPADLDAWHRPELCWVAVIVCAGDNLRPLAVYVRDRRLDPDRFHFYLHPDASRETLRPWAEAGLPLDHVDDAGKGGRPLTDWAALHGLLGVHFNLRILHDVLAE